MATAWRVQLKSESNLFVVLNQRENIDAIEFRAAVEKRQFHRKGGAFDYAAEFLHKLCGGRSRAASGEQIIANNHALAWLHGIFVDFEGVRSIFEGIGNAGSFRGQLFWFSNRNEPRSKAIRERRSKNESARLDARHNIDGVPFVVLAEPVDERMESHFVLQQGGQVIEENPRLGIIRHFANQLLQVIHSNGSSSSSSLSLCSQAFGSITNLFS